jgi:hypothetical protein
MQHLNQDLYQKFGHAAEMGSKNNNFTALKKLLQRRRQRRRHCALMW